MASPTAFSVAQIAMDGWRLGATAMIKMPQHFVTAYVLYAIVDWIVLPLTEHAGAFAGPLIATVVIGSLLSALLAALVSIPVYRAMLLGDTRDLPIWHLRPGCGRFVGFALLLKLLFTGPLFATGLFLGTGTGGRFVSLAIQLAALYVAVRLVLVFPLSAISAPGGIIGSAWRASHGHFWKVVGVNCVGLLPLVVLMITCVMVTSHFLSLATVLGAVTSRPAMLLGIAVQLFVFSLIAVMTSRLYQAMVVP